MTNRDDLRELLGLMLAHYQTVQPNESEQMRFRKNGQTVATAEVLRHIDGIGSMLADLREFGYVPLDLADLPPRFGGTAPEEVRRG